MNNDIEQFEKAILDVLQSIDQVKAPCYEINYKISLTYNLIDLMSKAIYPSLNRKHKNKFIKFIDEFSGWKYKDYISLPQLELALQNEPNTNFNELRDIINKELGKWPYSRPISLEYDMHIKALVNYWPINNKIKNQWKLEDFTHKSLMYKQRNSLIHEMRSLGKVLRLFDVASPHYISRGIVKNDPNTKQIVAIEHEIWELTYPYEFYYELIQECIPKVSDYFRENDVNPYEQFKFGSSWL